MSGAGSVRSDTSQRTWQACSFRNRACAKSPDTSRRAVFRHGRVAGYSRPGVDSGRNSGHAPKSVPHVVEVAPNLAESGATFQSYRQDLGQIRSTMGQLGRCWPDFGQGLDWSGPRWAHALFETSPGCARRLLSLARAQGREWASLGRCRPQPSFVFDRLVGPECESISDDDHAHSSKVHVVAPGASLRTLLQFPKRLLPPIVVRDPTGRLSWNGARQVRNDSKHLAGRV